jgi:hypothetical protein
MPWHFELTCDTLVPCTTRLIQAPLGGISSGSELYLRLSIDSTTSVELGAVPPRGGIITSLFIRVDEIAVLISW